jgi:hypothetical protein
MTSQMTLSTYSNNLPANQNEWALLLDQARCFLQSGLLPKALQKPEQVVLVMLKGRELGIPPLQALSHINVINGKPAMSAELMLAQILKLHPKTQFKFPERTNEKCTISVKRAGFDFENFTFTIDDARKAGLLSNPSWNKYPRAMLHARVVSEMARSLFPDAIAGISYTPEELGAVVDENGDVIEILTETQEALPPPEPKPVTQTSAPSATPCAPSVPAEKRIMIFQAHNKKLVQVAKEVLAQQLKPEQVERALTLLEGKQWSKATVTEIIDTVKFEAEVYETFAN